MNLLDNLSMRRKMMLLSLIFILLAAVTAFTGYNKNEADKNISRAHKIRYQSFRLADEFRQSSDDLTRLARTYVVTTEAKWLAQYNEVLDIRSGKISRPIGYDQIYWDFRASDLNSNQNRGEKISLLEMMMREGFTPSELAKLDEAAKNSAELVSTEIKAMDLIRTGNGSDHEQARILMHDNNYHLNKAKIMAPVNEFFDLLDKRTQHLIDESESKANIWTYCFIFGMGGMLTTAFIVMNAVFISITKSMKQAISVAEEVANGNLAVNIPKNRKDEIGLLFNSLSKMIIGLEHIVNQVRYGANTLSAASKEISQGNQDLSARTEAQASALQQTAASMEELNATVHQNAESAKKANFQAQNASTVATKGGSVVASVVQTMSQISESSKKIAQIINVIDGIAFQTNILALNAAVEAARAGDQGRGFAVVAAEVRSLAGRSAAAAKEIKELIDESVKRVDQGSDLVHQAGNTMSEIVTSIQRMTEIMAEISSASIQQSTGVAQVSDALTQMDQATQQNAALVEEIAAAAGGLSSQSQELVETVGAFKVGLH